MIIHLEVEWDDEILERFALVIAQQSIHFALQLNWILQGALQDYQPESTTTNTGSSCSVPNPTYHPKYYTRCLKLLRNVESCVVYGRPRSQELQRLYMNGQINKQEMEQLEHADRRFNALEITTQNNEAYNSCEGEINSLFYVQMPVVLAVPEGTKKTSSMMNLVETTSYVQRYCVLERHVLNFYIVNLSSCGGTGTYRDSRNASATTTSRHMKLDRAISLERATVYKGLPDTDGSSAASSSATSGLLIRIVRTTFGDEFRIRCTTPEEQTLWLRRLGEETQGSTLFRTSSTTAIGGTNDLLTKDLSPTQLDRYNLFNNERLYIHALTDIAESLRFQDRTDRKINAPKLIAEMNIPEMIYLPLCNSSDIWRRVIAPIPNETRVFNTKARCPVIMYFTTKRGERIKHTGYNQLCDPNLDVAEFLHLYFDVPEPIVEEEEEQDVTNDIEIESSSKKKVTIKIKDDAIRTSEHNSAVWTSEEHEDDDDDVDGTGNSEPASAQPLNNIKGNKKVQRMLRESVIMLPNKLSKRLQQNKSKRVISVMDRQTQMQPMVPIIAGRADDNDNASIGDGTVVSIERSSILVQDQILYGDLDEGKIDLQSIDRAKQHVGNGESWAEKSARMLEAAKLVDENTIKENGGAANSPGGTPNRNPTEQLEIASCMAKSNDDLRQEVFVMQMIHYYKSVFAQAKLPLWLKTYRILSTSNSTGLIEVLVDATSLDGLKKSNNYPTKEEGGLRTYFERVYDGPNSDAFKAAQTNFMQSLAAYALVSYFLGLKDRHNGNIMIDTRGHLIFIDFGFAFGMAPGHEFSMERAPFKLTKEYVEVMGGTRSDCYKEFERLFVAGFEECRRNSQIALGLVEIMMYQSNYPCFSGSRYGNGKALNKFERRLMLHITNDHRIKRKALQLIRKSRRHFGTYLYDVFQKATNGYAI
jgi:phosphatidylinositol 4-kinase A